MSNEVIAVVLVRATLPYALEHDKWLFEAKLVPPVTSGRLIFDS